MIYFINKTNKKILKTLKSSMYATEKYEAGEYGKLYGLYDIELHSHYVSDHKYAKCEILDGIVTEIIEESVIIEKTEKEKEIERLNLELEVVQKALENPYRLLNGHRTLEEEVKILIARHRELSFDLYLLEQI